MMGTAATMMMAMFGWRDHKMPALYIAKASLDKLAIAGMTKIEAYDQTENIANLAMPIDQNRTAPTRPCRNLLS